MFNSFGSPLKYFEKTNHENNFPKKFFLKVILKLDEKCDELDIWFWTLPLRVEEWVFKIMMSKTFLLFFAIFSTFPKEHEHVLYGTGFWDSYIQIIAKKKERKPSGTKFGNFVTSFMNVQFHRNKDHSPFYVASQIITFNSISWSWNSSWNPIIIHIIPKILIQIWFDMILILPQLLSYFEFDEFCCGLKAIIVCFVFHAFLFYYFFQALTCTVLILL